MKEIYADNSATTKIDDTVLEAILPYYTEFYGNPGSLHEKGIKAAEAVDKARNSIAQLIGGRADEIIFTGSGTEANNLAIKGFAKKHKDRGNHIITTSIEHPSTLNCCRELEKTGYNITYLKVDKEGFINLDQLREAITKDTLLVSIIYANNEIGTIQDIKGIARICKEHKLPLHIDACQAAPYLDLDVDALGVDLMTLNASKIYGPKGIGALYKRRSIALQPIITGGGQEHSLRGGTENTPGIVGFARALELVRKNQEKESLRLSTIRDNIIQALLEIPDTILNGPKDQRLPNNINISFKDIEGESVILLLSEEGIYASTRSACSSKKTASSHVLKAIGVAEPYAKGSIRLSLGKDNTSQDAKRIIEKTKEIVLMLRHV